MKREIIFISMAGLLAITTPAWAFKISGAGVFGKPVHENITSEALTGITVYYPDATRVHIKPTLIKYIQEENTENDEHHINDGSLHFDDSRLEESAANIFNSRLAAQTAFRKGKTSESGLIDAPIQENLGMAIHTLQDFFAHSTWVETNQELGAFDNGNQLKPFMFKKLPYPKLGIDKNPFGRDFYQDANVQVLDDHPENDHNDSVTGGCIEGKSSYNPKKMQLTSAYYDYAMTDLPSVGEVYLGESTTPWNKRKKLNGAVIRTEGEQINWPIDRCVHGDKEHGINKDDSSSGLDHKKAYNAAVEVTRRFMLNFLKDSGAAKLEAKEKAIGFLFGGAYKMPSLPKISNFRLDSVVKSTPFDSGDHIWSFSISDRNMLPSTLGATFNGLECEIAYQQYLMKCSGSGKGTLKIYQKVNDLIFYQNDQFVIDPKITVSPKKPIENSAVSFSLDMAFDSVSSVVWKFGETVVEVFKDFAAAISQFFGALGDVLVSATVKDNQGADIAIFTTTVNVAAAKPIGTVTPNQVIRTQPQQLTLTGESVPSKLRIETTGGICSNPMDVTSTSFTLNCDFDVVGDQTITVFNADTNQVAGSVVVKVKSNVTAVKWGINNGTVRFGDTITYTVEGVNLTGGMGFAVERCGVSNTEVGAGTDTQRSFQCFFNPDDGAFAGQMAGVVKDKPDGQVLFNFVVPVEVPPTTGGGVLPATGITLCGNETTNGLLCTPEALGALYGLGQDGEVQAGQKMSYTVLNRSGDECVQDNVTGLIWEQKTDDGGLRDKDWKYTWYNANSATNGGNAGRANGGSCFNKSGGAQCDTAGYVAALNAANYCGYSDWRMPTRMELVGLVDYGRFNPSINPVFANTQSNWYWSASPDAGNNLFAWGVYFYNGYTDNNGKDYNNDVRAVRAGHEQR